jgi:hypothetical protein
MPVRNSMRRHPWSFSRHFSIGNAMVSKENLLFFKPPHFVLE